MKVVSVFIILSILLFGCSQNTISETSAMIWITGYMSKDSYLFEIKDDGKIKMMRGNVIFDTETKEVFCGENVKTKLIVPDAYVSLTVKDIITEIESKGEGMINPGNDTVEIFACINNRIYWSPFYNDSSNNKELLELTNLLLEIS